MSRPRILQSLHFLTFTDLRPKSHHFLTFTDLRSKSHQLIAKKSKWPPPCNANALQRIKSGPTNAQWPRPSHTLEDVSESCYQTPLDKPRLKIHSGLNKADSARATQIRMYVQSMDRGNRLLLPALRKACNNDVIMFSGLIRTM